MKSIKNDEISKKFISDDKFLKNNQFTDSLDTENIIKLLKEKPYLLNQPQEKFGFTILYKAVVNKNYNLCEFLIENNADPNLKNIYGETPLHQAIEVENNKIINLLLENGADPNSKTNDGETPMHIASIKGNYKIVKLLLLYGANPYIRTYNTNYSPFDYAAESNQIKVVNLLNPLMEIEHLSTNNKIKSLDEARGFKSTKNNDSPINRLKQNVDMYYGGIGNISINNTTKNCRNTPLSNENFHERTKSAQNYNQIELNDIQSRENYNKIDLNDIQSRENNCHIDSKKDNFSFSFLNQVSMFEAKIEKIKHDLANININSDNFKTSISNNNNLNCLKSNDLFHKRHQSNVYHKTNNTICSNIYNSYNQGEFISNVASPINTNVELSKELRSVLNIHKKNTISVDNSLYNSIENLYPSFKNSHYSQNFNENLIKSNQIKQQTPESKNVSINTGNNFLNTTLLNKIQQPQTLNHSTIKKLQMNINNYTLNGNQSRVLTLKPEELGESYEKQPININGEESRITYNTNFGLNNVEEIFNLPLQQKNFLSSNMKISQHFWNDIESGRNSKKKKKSNKQRISENFYDDQKILAIFSSSSNDIFTQSEPKYHYNSIDKAKNIEFESFNNINKNIHSGYNSNMNYNNKNISLNNTQENLYSEQNITTKRDVKNYSKKTKNNKDRQISLDIQQSLSDDIKLKKELNNNDRIVETDLILHTENSKEIFNFLNRLELEKFTKYFIKNGFDDINVIIEQLRNGYGLTDQNLKEIGIKFPGKKVCICFKKDAKLFDFHIPLNTYHNISEERLRSNYINDDTNLRNLKNWLSLIKVENFFSNFIENGYHSLELLLMQMASKNPITDKIIEEELKISKIGYRVRILNKLKSDSKLYIEKYKGKEIRLFDKKNEISDPCKCTIF